MESRTCSVFGALSVIISDAALLSAAYMIVGMKDSSDLISIGFFPWVICAAASYFLFGLFLRKERTLPQAAGFLATAYVLTAAVLLVFFVRLFGPLSYVIAVIFWSLPFWHIYSMTETPLTLEKMSTRFEGIIFVSLAVLIVILGTGNSLVHILPCALALAFCLVSLIVMRTAGSETGGRGIRGAAVILALMLIIAAGIAAFLIFASVPVGDAVTAAAVAVLAAFKYLWRLLLHFLEWLVSLLPVPDGDDIRMEPVAGMPEMSEEIEGLENFGPTVLLIVICVGAALVALLAVILVIKLRRTKLGGAKTLKHAAVKRGKKRERTPFFRLFLAKVRFFIDSIIYRNTPQGVLVHLERWGRVHRKSRAVGETARRYLMRLADDMPEKREALSRLSDAIDARFYGDTGRCVLAKKELAAIRRSFAV